jgi:hypothetical protein
MKKSLLLAVLVFLGMMLPAAAQTAEEAVAYAFLGLADGATIERTGTTMKWVETAASPATFDGDVIVRGHAAKIRFIVADVENCRYEITLEGPPELVPGGSRLFGKVALHDVADVTIAEDGFRTTIDGIGFCETGQRNPTCMTLNNSDLFGTVDLDRHRETLAFLRKTCAPSN